MKKLLIVAALGAAGLASTGVQAQGSTNGNFNVVINLTAACQVAAIGDINLSYTAFGAVANGSTNANVACTNGLPYSLQLDGGQTTVNTLDDAVQLNYTLDVAGGYTGFAGTGSPVAHTINASIAAGQAGDCGGAATCNNAAATNRNHTLTVSW